MGFIMTSKLAARIAAAAGVCAAVALTAAPASAGTGAARPAQPLITHTAGPFSTETSCAVSEGAGAAAGEDIVRDCFRKATGSGVGGSLAWYYQYSVFF
jgi:hypothetical protein